MLETKYMKNTKTLVIIISTALLVVGIATASFITDYSSTIASVVTTITAVVGAIALYFQLKKDKEINQATFIINFYETFNGDEHIQRIYKIINQQTNGENVKLVKDDYNDLISYLTWIRSLCSFLEKGTLSFNIVDEIFGYKFFAIINNKQVQDMEIVSYHEYYKLIYQTHHMWTAYRRKHKKYIPCEETSLEKAYTYKLYVN